MEQLLLIPPDSHHEHNIGQLRAPESGEIPGLIVRKNYIDREHESLLINLADRGVWQSTLRRRVQHYGYRYDYQVHTALRPALPLPPWALEISNSIALFLYNLIGARPEYRQMIINEYLPGQGIGPHVDRTEHFGDYLAVLSLGSDTGYRFILPDYAAAVGRSNKANLALELLRSGDILEDKKYLLPARSLVIMTGISRFYWMHGMPARRSDVIDGVRSFRSRRISLTWRTLADC